MTSHYNVRLSALVAGQKCEFETNFFLPYQHLVITRANFHRVTLGDLQPKLVDFYHSIDALRAAPPYHPNCTIQTCQNWDMLDLQVLVICLNKFDFGQTYLVWF